jgi:DnaJ-class molecular chaperone
MSDYYKILEVSEDSLLDDIKKSYRLLCMKWHPDRNKEPQAEAKFKTINEAYETLGDEEKRKQYDISRRAPPVLPQVHMYQTHVYQTHSQQPARTTGFSFYNEAHRNGFGQGMDQETLRRMVHQQVAQSFFGVGGGTFSEFRVYSDNGVFYQSYRTTR